MDILDQIRQNSYFKTLVTKNVTDGVFLIGSLLHKNYINGWSDIDMVVISEAFTLDYLKLIKNFIKSLSESTQIKVGIETLSLLYLNKAVNKEVCPGNMVKVAKNFYENSSVWTDGILYKRNNIKFPIFKLGTVTSASIFSYTISSVEYINKLMIANSDLKDKKAILRKAIKNSLLLMQTYLLFDSGKLTTSFSDVVESFKKNYPEIDIKVLEISFNKRFEWGHLKDGDIENKEIEENLRTLNLLADFIVSKTS